MSQVVCNGKALRRVERILPKGGDIIDGDKVQEDKVQGDKIGRDKIVYTRTQVNDLDDYLQKAVFRFETQMFQLLRPQSLPSHPYKFLYPFTIKDRHIFFGRDMAVENLYQTILKDKLTIFHAPSGAGKTSLLNAGLAPKLVENCRLPIYARAYENPSLAIKQALASSTYGTWPELLKDLSLHEFLGLASIHLSREIKELVIILDQFEEFFIFPPDESTRRQFIANLAISIYDNNLPIRFVIAIRKDFYSDLATLKGDVPTIFFNEYRLNSLNREEAELAITGPLSCQENAISVEKDLLEILLEDLYRTGIELPHLQIICTQLYGALQAGENKLGKSLYQELGGSEGILGSYLINELHKFPGRKSKIAKAILSELVSSESTKRVLSYMALATRIDCNPEEFDDTLDRLVNARLLFRWEASGIISYEMAHDYLVTEISQWVDQNDLEFKKVDELLGRELITWRVHSKLIPSERLALLLPHREKFKTAEPDAQLLFYLSALKCWDEDIQLWAIESLGYSGDERAIEPLIQVIKNNFGTIQSSATKALSQFGPAAVPHLLTMLRDENVHIRSSAASALGMIGEPAAEPLLAALEDEDESVRISAAKTLGQLKNRQLVLPFIKTLNDSNASMRFLSARALGRLQDKRATEPLVQALKDKDWRVRDRAAQALGLLGDSRAIKPLISMLTDADDRVRLQAYKALEKQHLLALYPLIEELKNDNCI